MFKNYRLNDLFSAEYVYDYVIKQGHEIKNTIPNLQNILDIYREKLRTADTGIEFPTSLLEKEIYTKEVYIDNNNYYEITWDIEKTKDIISSYNIPVSLVKTTQAYNLTQKNEIDEKRLVHAQKNNKPVIIAETPNMKPNFILIDGNHRVVAKHKLGLELIEAYVLQPGFHISGMINDLSRVLFVIHYDIWLFESYLAGLCDKEYVNSRKSYLISNVFAS